MNGYINLDKEHSDFMSTLKKIGIKKIKLDKVENQNQVDIVITSLSKYCLLYTSPSPRDS